MKEISILEQLHLQAFDNLDLFTTRIVLVRTLNYLLSLSQEDQLHILHENLKSAVELVKLGKDLTLYLVDKTKTGGAHEVRIRLNVTNNSATIHLPDEPESGNTPGIKGGRFPTVCHGIEMVVVIYKMSGINFPNIEFALPEEIEKSSFEKPLLIPLTLNPANTNLMVFHTQSRSIDPYSLAKGWYKIMKCDETLTIDPLRHTILLMPKSNSTDHHNPYFKADQPKSKNCVYVEVLPKEIVEDRNRFRPMHLNRMSRWKRFGNKTKSPTIVREGTRYLMTLN